MPLIAQRGGDNAAATGISASRSAASASASAASAESRAPEAARSRIAVNPATQPSKILGASFLLA